MGCQSISDRAPAEELTTKGSFKHYLDQGLTGMLEWLDSSFIPLAKGSADKKVLVDAYRKGRAEYKKIAVFVEYFYPTSCRHIIGPALDEIEPEEHQVLDPGGFQVMEESLFDSNPEADNSFLLNEAKKLRSIFFRLQTISAKENFRDDQVFDAIRQDIVRMASLQLTGFDAPVSLEGLQEVPISLESYRRILAFYQPRIDAKHWSDLDGLLKEAIAFVNDKKNDFDSFPRLAFIRLFLNPISEKILEMQQLANIDVLVNTSAMNMLAPHVFTDSSIRPAFFIPDAGSGITAERTLLGQKLFNDPILSDSNNISCASCHLSAKAFSDGLTTHATLSGNGLLRRNTPGLYYAGLQKAQFMDMRVAFLEDQVKDVVENKDEFHGNLSSAILKLQKDSFYSSLFVNAFPSNSQGIKPRHIQIALAAYVRSLNPFKSKFDAFMAGDTTALTAVQQRGFDLFAGKAKCATCHFIPVFNGTVPPVFDITEGEVLGIMDRPGSQKVDNDPGRYAIYKIDNFKHAFKTPGLRNVSATAPYMHHGQYGNLNEVMDFYNSGGALGRGIPLENQTLPGDSLHLTKQEISAIIGFMESLTDL